MWLFRQACKCLAVAILGRAVWSSDSARPFHVPTHRRRCHFPRRRTGICVGLRLAVWLVVCLLLAGLAEAHDGAPYGRLLTVNVTNLAPHFHDLFALSWVVCALQEVRQGPGWAPVRDMRRAGCSVVHTTVGADGLVLGAIIARDGKLVHREVPDGVPSHRLVHALWHSPSGQPWRIFNYYGPTAADEGKAVARSCLAFALRTPQVPTLMVGDFNLVLEGHPLEEILRLHGWHNPLFGQPTSNAATPMRRIDWLLYNRMAGWQVRNAWVDWTVPVPTHAAQWLELPLGERSSQPVWVGAVVPDPVAPVSRKAARRLGEGLRGVCSAVCARRLDEAWERFDAAVSRWHAAADEAGRG